MVSVKKQEGESNFSLLRRFSRKVQQSGILLKARKNRFYQKPKTKRERYLAALFREEIRKEKNRLMKQGLLKKGELLDIQKFKLKIAQNKK